MKHNARKLLAVILALAMLLSFVAVSEDGLTELGMDQPIEIEGEVGTDGDTQAPEGEVEIDMDEAEGLPDGEIDPEGGEDLPIDLDGEALEMGEEELAPVTEEAMNDGETPDGTEDKPVPITSWVELYGHMSQGPTESEDKKRHYRLENDVSPLNNQQKRLLIAVPSGRHVVLDLNGFKIDRSLTSATPDGYVISVQGDLTITGNGTITGGYNFGNGGGVCVDGGTFTMESGKIIGNTADGDGGGVYVVKGATFTMEGDSRINGNKSGYNGGGVYVSKGTFTMKDGTIGGTGDDKNTATFGSGVYVGDGSTFTMSGGKISENVANNKGGGVFLETYGEKITFTMSGNSKFIRTQL